MKRLIYILIFPFIINAQDIAGNYQLSGLYKMSQQISRDDQSLFVSDIHGLGIALPIAEIHSGEIFEWTERGPWGNAIMAALAISLNMSLNPDGIGEIGEGSYMPVEVIDFDNCITSIAIMPVMEQFFYQSDLDAGYAIPSSSILGPLFYQSPFMGEIAGILSFSGSDYLFPDFPPFPIHPTLCDGLGYCFDIDLSSFGGDIVEGGEPLPGWSGGFVLKGDLPSFLVDQGNEISNLYIEYFSIDGSSSNMGLGNVVGVDEDGDGTDFDRIGNLEYLNGTYLYQSCGFNYPIFGDVTDVFENMGLGSCIVGVDFVNEGYIMDPSFSVWGNFITFNAVMFQLTQQTQYLTDDSDHDYNSINGRLVWGYSPQCIPMIYNEHAMLEFIEVGGCSYELGDLNGDGGWNVLDIVTLANCILVNNCSDIPTGCASDLNGDGDDNVLDIVALVNCVLAGNCGEL